MRRSVILPKGIRHIIWDWNGTLLDDTELTVVLLNKILRADSLPEINLEGFRQTFDFPISDFYRQLGYADPEQAARAMSDWMAAYEADFRGCALRRGTREILQALVESGITNSVLSAHTHDDLVAALNHFDIASHFVLVSGAAAAERGLSKAARGQKLMEQIQRDWGVSAAETVLIGDTCHDYEVAAALGVQPVLISGGVMDRKRLAQTEAVLIESLAELAAWLTSTDKRTHNSRKTFDFMLGIKVMD